MILLRHARGGGTNLWTDWPHREPAVTVRVDVPADSEITEADVRAVAAMDIEERTRPVDALVAYTEEPGSVAEAGVRQEDGVAVWGVHLIAFHAALCGPDHGAVVSKFLEFIFGRHAPRRAELLCSGVVGRVENGLVVADEVAGGVIPDGVGHAVGEGVFRDVLPFGLAVLHPLVGRPSVFFLRLGLAPGVVVARL